jgi:hypothetical protein
MQPLQVKVVLVVCMRSWQAEPSSLLLMTRALLQLWMLSLLLESPWRVAFDLASLDPALASILGDPSAFCRKSGLSCW